MKIKVLKGDITDLECDAIVNAANSRLQGGGGVDGAIHDKAGPDLIKECETLGGCPTGEARLTKGYNLKARYVIHAVGPVWRNGQEDEMMKLKRAYENALSLASENGFKSIAFPNISTGIYGFPKKLAAEIASGVVRNAPKNGIEEVFFVCFDDENYSIYKEKIPEV